MLCCVVWCSGGEKKVGHTQLVNQFMFVKCTRGKASSLWVPQRFILLIRCADKVTPVDRAHCSLVFWMMKSQPEKN